MLSALALLQYPVKNWKGELTGQAEKERQG